MTDTTLTPIAAKVKLFLVFGGFGGFGVEARWGVGVGGAGLGGAVGLGWGVPWRMLAGIPAGRCGGFGVCSIITKLLLLINYSIDLFIVNCLRPWRKPFILENKKICQSIDNILYLE